ncbi:SDR family NAD(P)-dependent oxidoreductase [Streptomyces sp. NPDC049687]|uniref:SDR family NAD(P)-dependent oxidoreductase n=1 Tax=Streptomyces sp. NPDC049687 TaxID=3365596 RepID=UPI0037951CC9
MPIVEPIAVIGLAARLPEARDVEQYWSNLVAGRDCITELTDEELLAAGEDPAALASPSYVRANPLLPDCDGFDARFFGMTPREAELRDPQHRLFLELCHTVLGHAGYDPARYDGTVGVFAGSNANGYAEQNLRSHPDMVAKAGEMVIGISNHTDYLSTFVSYKLGLRGPSLSVATACSTSLVGVHLACQSLRAGECEMAIAGGVEVEMPYGRGYRHAAGGINSAAGRCRPFDAGADGTIFGSGGGAVLLKRLSDAQADGDNVLAVIRGSAINNDGSDKAGFTAPGVNGQSRCIVEAYTVADVDPADVGYVEAHGTGTLLGDPVEVTALTMAFDATAGRKPARGGCGIGSVKSNIGHLGPAAGVAGLIKTVLALHHEQIPPTIHYEKPNPHLKLESTPFRIVDRLSPWPRTDVPRRAGVSSFGIGGTNAHVVLEEAPESSRPEPDSRAHLLAWSAHDEQDERAFRDALADRLSAEPGLALDDVAFTLQDSRTGHPPVRAAVVAADTAAAARLLAQHRPAGLRLSDGTTRTRVFAFPGQGAQQPAMGAALRQDDPVFRGHLDRLLTAFSDELGTDLAGELRSGTPERLRRTDLAQPLLSSVELAIAHTLRHYGAIPDVLIGHSLGELVAATVAGVFGEEDAIRAISARALAMHEAPPGAMLAVTAGPDTPGDLTERLLAGVSVCAFNSAAQTVLGGSVELIREQAELLGAAGWKVRVLETEHAFHTPMMRHAAQRFGDTLRAIPLRAPAVPLVSAATGARLTDAQACDPEFWAGQLTAPVRFADAARTLLREPAVVVETGPGATLSTLLRAHPGGHVISGALPRQSGADRESFLDALGTMWVNGADIRWDLLRGGDTRRVALPAYPYRRTRYWIDPPATTITSAGAAPAAAGTSLAEPPAKTDPHDQAQPAEAGLWTPRWTREALLQPAPYQESGRRGTALLVADRTTSVTRGVATALRTAGYQVVSAEHTPHAGGADSGEADDRAAVRRLLAEAGPALTRVVHVVQADAGAGTGTLMPGGFATALALCQELAGQATELTLVTTEAADVSGGERVSPATAMLTGLVRTAAQELAGLRPRLIDIGGTVSPEVLAAELLAAEGVGEHPVSALRGQHRWVPGWSPADLVGAPPELLCRGGVYVITGGFGALGLEAARALASTRIRPKLVLIGRGGLPEGPAAAGVRTVLDELADQGATVLALAADVSDPASLASALAEVRERFGRVNGVLHAAGVAGGGMLALRDPREAAAVLAPKVIGIETLAHALSDEPDLDFVLLYSSRAAISGLIGSGDYAAANAYLDAWSGRTISGAPVISVIWPAWSEVGMAARSTTLGNVRAAAGHTSPRLSAGDREWTTTLDPETDWVLTEHRVAGRPVVPGTGQIDLVVRAARAIGVVAADAPVELADIVFTAPLAVEQPTEIRITFEADGFRIGARAAHDRSSAWTEHSSGRITEAEGGELRPIDPLVFQAQDEEPLRLDEPSRRPDALVHMGPRWGGAVKVHSTSDGDLATVFTLDPQFAADLDTHPAHPALLDRATGLVQAGGGAGHLPFHYQRLVLFTDLPSEILVRAHNLRSDSRSITGDVDVHDSSGRPVLLVRGFRMRRVDQANHTSADGAAGTTRLDNAITPEEGNRLLLRILSGRIRGQIAVTPAGFPLVSTSGPVEAAAVMTTPPVPAVLPRTVVPTDTAEAGIESEVRALWAEALGVPGIGPDDDFFAQGGDSLTAVQLTTRINDRFGTRISIGTLFENPTARQMAETVK